MSAGVVDAPPPQSQGLLRPERAAALVKGENVIISGLKMVKNSRNRAITGVFLLNFTGLLF
jgi:hypothetical protein